MTTENEIKVWDPLVRIFHWTLVVAFFTAYFTEDEWLDIHVLAGYTVAGLIAFRLVWGFVGTKHARFSDFVFSPLTTLNYLKDLFALRAKRYIGHNPAGGAMVITLLLALAGTTLTGMKLYAVEENAGPFAAVQIENVSPISSAVADDDDDEYGEHGEGHGEGDEELWEELHEFFANFTLLLVFLHVAGVVVSSFAHGENLSRAMMTGRKKRE
ncbi:MAG: cytochrome b/b6 domain-containing protein [Gammaproteobacteria bacterium]|nr:cytochrome b/b6 domain-containing protein [Gammaproteobacteria bacterium]MCW8928243.1 cytochrome b/b6 domain-containing protein [Gammaproteobacteria bacterium]MCW8957667.1 cytochrome b/b6 domain-containing protein [Gammaproteobacteria bacterium]MCW8971718.1 cytochrome b/b6 domain-containing protein [Gammaproteobacteria bacterium]